MKTYHHIPTGIIGKTNDKDYFLHFARGKGEIKSLESISIELVENSNDWEDITEIDTPQEKIPTPWFKTEEMETWIGEPLTTEGKTVEELNGGRGKLIVLHQCGENEQELISQLETLIYGIKGGFEDFAN
jgi:hypothetical protein